VAYGRCLAVLLLCCGMALRYGSPSPERLGSSGGPLWVRVLFARPLSSPQRGVSQGENFPERSGEAKLSPVRWDEVEPSSQLWARRSLRSGPKRSWPHFPRGRARRGLRPNHRTRQDRNLGCLDGAGPSSQRPTTRFWLCSKSLGWF
jgi:hypothetical protein